MHLSALLAAAPDKTFYWKIYKTSVGLPAHVWTVVIGCVATLFSTCVCYNTGAVLTTIVLASGLVSFHRGNAKLSQNIMRLRVVAQGGTVLALCGGVYVGFRSNN